MSLQLSVIILNYNVSHYLELCLSSVERAVRGLDAEVIVVDNASKDDSLEMLSRKHPNIMVIANKQNLGFAKANNIGVAKARGKYICILNPDTMVPEDCFETLLAFAERQKNLGAVGARLVDGGGRFLPESKRNLPTPPVALAKILGNNRGYYNEDLKPEEDGETPVLVGAMMFLKKETYCALGGFDEDYFMYGEDIDLSYRLQKKGFTNYYLGSLPVIHFKGESTLRNKTYAKHFYGAMAVFHKKHFENSVGERLLVNSLLRVIKRCRLLVSAREEKCTDLLPWTLYGADAKFGDLARAHFGESLNICDRLNGSPFDFRESKVIFDAGSCDFKTIIETMSALNNHGNRFYIRPPGCNFILGSNQSTRRGSVQVLRGLKN